MSSLPVKALPKAGLLQSVIAFAIPFCCTILGSIGGTTAAAMSTSSHTGAMDQISKSPNGFSTMGIGLAVDTAVSLIDCGSRLLIFVPVGGVLGLTLGYWARSRYVRRFVWKTPV